MKNQLLHTPEGVRDIYGEECEQKRLMEHTLLDTAKSYGYHPIQTPVFEYFDIFGKEIGTTPSKDLYKFFDHEGNTLVLRPDFTPSIARCASKYFMEEEMPIRFCYTGNAFRNSKSLQGRLREMTQQGAELIGDDSVEADAELLALTVEELLASGLREFQVSVGHVDYLGGLLEAANLGEEKEDQIKKLLSNRNFYGVDEVVDEENLDEDLVFLFRLLHDVMLTKDKITAAKQRAARFPKVYAALERLEALEDLLRIYDVHRYVYYELAMVSDFDYYSGIIFAAYTYGSGEAVATGGRYDNLLASFGKSAPAIGMAVAVDSLMSALRQQDIEIPYINETHWFVYRESLHGHAIAAAKKMRKDGGCVEMIPWKDGKTREFYEESAKRQGIERISFYI